MLFETNEPYVFPKHCNQLVFFHFDVLDRDWWFVLRHDSRSKHIFENNSVVMRNDEDNQGDGNEEWCVNVLFQHFILLVCRFLMNIYNRPIIKKIIHFVMLDIRIVYNLYLQPSY